jgi:long-chain acyl-CoA synthetase
VSRRQPRYRNLGEFLGSSADVHRDRVAFEIQRGLRRDRLTFREAHDRGLRLAAYFRDRGLRKGDRVALFAPNMPETVTAFYGCWLAGLVVVPIDVRMAEVKIRDVLALTEPRRALVSKTTASGFPAGGVPADVLEGLADRLPRPPGTESADIGPDDPAEIVLTSGTTGSPQGVVLTHGNLLFDMAALRRVFPMSRRIRALSLLPLSHAYEQMIELLVAFAGGMRFYYPARYDLSSILRAFRMHRITAVSLVPQVMAVMMRGIRRRAEDAGRGAVFERALEIADRLPRPLRRRLFSDIHRAFGGKLSFFIVGGAPLDPGLRRDWERLGVLVYEGYGTTELTMTLSVNTPRASRAGSVGRVIPGVDVRIDETGEILVRGPIVSPGYFGNPDKTAAAYRDGWFHTGDIGYFDEGGYLFLRGRTAFRIVRPNGTKVHPEAVESVLKAVPGVRDACVIGRRGPAGEVVHAVLAGLPAARIAEIVGEANRALDEDERIDEASLWPGEDFPRTPTLKIDRARVRNEVEGHGAPAPAPETPAPAGPDLSDLLAAYCRRPRAEIGDDARLGDDLGIDSLGRLELLALIESRWGVSLDGRRLTSAATVRDLSVLIGRGTEAREDKIPSWPHRSLATAVRSFFRLAVILPVHRLFVKTEIRGSERLEKADGPHLFYFNHVGPFDAVACWRALPERIRRGLVILTDRQGWDVAGGIYGFILRLFFGGLPIADRGVPVASGLERIGLLAADGASLLVAPEGTFSPDGRLGDFKPGAGLLAVELRLPVVPIYIDPSYQTVFRAFPFGNPANYLPKRRGRVLVSIGSPLTFPEGTPPAEAAARMREAMIELAGGSGRPQAR